MLKQKLLLLILCLFTLPTGLLAEEWIVFTDKEDSIQFLSYGKPQKRKIDVLGGSKTIWHFGYLDDGTNGGIDATRLEKENLSQFNVIQEVQGLRAGIEQSGKTKVVKERKVTINGLLAVEFQTTALNSKGQVWHGLVRMLVVRDRIFTIWIVAPKPSRLSDKQISAFLNSFKSVP